MPEKVIKVEFATERIVTCPSCNTKNRLYKHKSKGSYKCGNCQNELSDPFISTSQAQIALKAWKIIAFSVLAVFGLLVFNRVSSYNASAPSPVIPESKDNASVPSPVIPESKPVATQPVVPLKNRTLPSSTVIISPTTKGVGVLKVSNGTSQDAYIKLVDSSLRKSVAAFYAKSNSTFTLKQIPNGDYQMLFVSGEDWDAKTRSFTRNKSFARFERDLNFTTTKQSNEKGVYTRYVRFELTLHQVANGNAKINPVNEQEFENY